MVVVHGLSSSAVCGIFPDQGSDSHLLHWQVDFSPLSHQGSPRFALLSKAQTMSLVLHRSLCGLQSCSTHPCSLGWRLGLTVGHPQLAPPCPVSFSIATHRHTQTHRHTHPHTHTRLNHRSLGLGITVLCSCCALCPEWLPKASNPHVPRSHSTASSLPDPMHLHELETTLWHLSSHRASGSGSSPACHCRQCMVFTSGPGLSWPSVKVMD